MEEEVEKNKEFIRMDEEVDGRSLEFYKANLKIYDLGERKNQIDLVLRDTRQSYILGDGKKVEIFDQNLKLIT